MTWLLSGLDLCDGIESVATKQVACTWDILRLVMVGTWKRLRKTHVCELKVISFGYTVLWFHLTESRIIRASPWSIFWFVNFHFAMQEILGYSQVEGKTFQDPKVPSQFSTCGMSYKAVTTDTTLCVGYIAMFPYVAHELIWAPLSRHVAVPVPPQITQPWRAPAAMKRWLRSWPIWPTDSLTALERKESNGKQWKACNVCVFF